MSLGANKQALMGAAGAAGGGTNFYSYQIANSIRGSASQNGTLQFTAGTPTSSTTMTMSYWVKRYTTSTDGGANNIFVTGTGGGAYIIMGFSSNAWQFQPYGGSWGTGGGITMNVSGLSRDTSAWYHQVLRIDTTESTQGDRVRLYQNGERITSFSHEGVTGNLSASESVSYINESGVVQAFGGLSGKGHGTEGADLQMAEIVFCDGQSLGPDSFGETKNGVWIPKDPSGLTFGNNGYWLKFTNSSNLGEDFSGNDNDFTVANFAAHDQLLDSPTFGSSNGGNFCTMNPLNSGSNNTFSEGNLKVTNTSGGCSALGTMSLVTGHKWYFEGKVTGSGNNWIGIIEENGYTNSANTNSSIAGSSGFNNYLYGYNGSIYYGANSTATGATITTNDIIGVLVDLESATNTIQFYKNGAAQGSAFNLTGTGINYTPMSDRGSGSGDGFWFNFGQEGTFGTGSGGGNSDVNGYGSFYYDDGAAAKAICTANLPVADAVDPAQTDDNYPQKLFGTLQYTGNGSERTIDTTFQIDKSWARSTVQGQDWYVLDTSRGYFGASSNNYYIKLNVEGGQASLPQYNFKAQSGSDITITSGTWLNSSGHTQQMWNWRLAGGTTSTNTQGGVNSTVQVDPSGCFSIVTYQAGLSSSGVVTVGHGLSKAPTFLIQTAYGSGVTGQRWVRSSGLTSWNYGIQITSNGAQQDKSGNGDMSADPTSSVFSVNYTEGLGDGSADNVTYAFADCEGYIKSGKFIGNANADGSYIYLGFKPAFFWILHAASGDDPQVWDTSNGSYNPMTKTLSTHNNSAQVDNANRSVDFLSNGVKIRSSNSNVNSSNAAGIIYLAMAKNPFKYATSR